MIGPASFIVDLTYSRRVRRYLDQVRKNISTNVINETSSKTETNDTTKTNDDFPISVPNSQTVEPPPSDVLPRESEHSELRHPDHTKCPPNSLLLTLIDTIVLEEEECCMHMLQVAVIVS